MSTANVIGFPGVSVRLTVDVIFMGTLTLSFDTFETYELYYQLALSGLGGIVIESFHW